MKAVVAAFNQEKALVGAFSVLTNLWMELFQALILRQSFIIKFSCEKASDSVGDTLGYVGLMYNFVWTIAIMINTPIPGAVFTGTGPLMTW